MSRKIVTRTTSAAELAWLVAERLGLDPHEIPNALADVEGMIDAALDYAREDGAIGEREYAEHVREHGPDFGPGMRRRYAA